MWLRPLHQTGDKRAKVREHRGLNNKITDSELFRANAYTHGDKTQVEMAE
ncbi:MAG: IS630 family transposase, partial [Moorea sp. SIO2I5]|nr:IS630 family transposase [Moorena sp. SIO2I5]